MVGLRLLASSITASLFQRRKKPPYVLLPGGLGQAALFLTPGVHWEGALIVLVHVIQITGRAFLFRPTNLRI